jgi:hypothetical protein
MKYVIALVLFLIWFLFIMFAPTDIVVFLMYIIGGWQVGAWIHDLSVKFSKE